MTEFTLAIETSNPSAGTGSSSGSVCLGTFDSSGRCTVVAHQTLSPSSRHDDALMPSIAAACKAAGVTPDAVGRVAVSIGPGGFTSVRIGVTTAKMIAEATGAACIGVPTALAVALGVQRNNTTPAPRGIVGVLLAWKREDVWRQRFRLDDPTTSTPVTMPIALDVGGIVPLAEAARGCDTVVGEDAVLAMLPGSGGDGQGCQLMRPDFDARWVLEAAHGIAPIDPALLMPLYPREPEAVTKWRTLHPRHPEVPRRTD